MTVSQRQDKIVEELLFVPDIHERLSIIVNRAAKHRIPESARLEQELVKGCISQVWLHTEVRDGVFHCQSDADSPMVKGLVHLLCELYNGAPADEVYRTEPDLWTRLGLYKILTPTRQNGLAAVRQTIRTSAHPSGA